MTQDHQPVPTQPAPEQAGRAPTKPGFYWFNHEHMGWIVVRVSESVGSLFYHLAGVNMPYFVAHRKPGLWGGQVVYEPSAATQPAPDALREALGQIRKQMLHPHYTSTALNSPPFWSCINCHGLWKEGEPEIHNPIDGKPCVAALNTASPTPSAASTEAQGTAVGATGCPPECGCGCPMTATNQCTCPASTQRERCGCDQFVATPAPTPDAGEVERYTLPDEALVVVAQRGEGGYTVERGMSAREAANAARDHALAQVRREVEQAVHGALDLFSQLSTHADACVDCGADTERPEHSGNCRITRLANALTTLRTGQQREVQG